MTTRSALAPPETRTKRSRMRRSFSLFSAPPMGMIHPRRPPAGTLLGIRSQLLTRNTAPTQKYHAGAPHGTAPASDLLEQLERQPPLERARLVRRKAAHPHLKIGAALLDA